MKNNKKGFFFNAFETLQKYKVQKAIFTGFLVFRRVKVFQTDETSNIRQEYYFTMRKRVFWAKII